MNQRPNIERAYREACEDLIKAHNCSDAELRREFGPRDRHTVKLLCAERIDTLEELLDILTLEELLDILDNEEPTRVSTGQIPSEQ